jgi:hypothetical protein
VVAVDLDAVRERLRAAGKEDLAAWERVRLVLRETVGESMFEIWLAPLELIAVARGGTLVVSVPEEIAGWVGPRYGRLLDRAAEGAGRRLRIADEGERTAAAALVPVTAASARPVLGRDVPSGGDVSAQGCAQDGSADPPAGFGAFRADRSPGRPSDASSYTSACGSSYAGVENQTKEVS